jgi:hypothetical protein
MKNGWLPPVERIVRSFAGLSESAPPFVLVEAARGTSRSLPTLLSFWQLQGGRLPESLRAELSYAQERLADYDDVLATVRKAEPGVVPLKGPAMWDRYPAGLVRETADLDLWLPSAESLWSVARHLVDSGWTTDVAWAWCISGQQHFHAVVKRPSRHCLLMARDRVELTTIAYQGDHVRRGPRLRRWDAGDRPSAADCLLWLLEELGERTPRMRDVFDLAVLADEATAGPEAFADECGELVANFQLHGPLRRLLAVAERHYPEALPVLAPVRVVSRRRPVGHAPWPLRRHPTAALVSAAVAVARADRFPAALRTAADSVLLAVQRRMPLPRLLARGIPLYGMPVPSSVTGEGVVAGFDDLGACWLDTPAGRFVGTLGPALDEVWVERATTPAGAAREVRLL